MFTGPLFKCFGSKWSAARRYPAPNRNRVVEMFGGSAGYSLRWAHTVNEVVICEQGHLWELWGWLLQANEADIREIPLNTPEGTDIRSMGLSRGQALLLKNWQRTNNVGDCWTISAWGHKPGQWTASTRSRVAEEVELLHNWRLTKAPHRESGVHFIDPLYEYNFKYRLPTPDYSALGRLVRKVNERNPVIVCEAACPKTGAHPTWLPFEPHHDQVTSRRKSAKSRELAFIRMQPSKEV